MITSVQAFNDRFVDKKINQRISFHVLGSWLRLGLSDDHQYAPNEILPANGILANVFRPEGRNLGNIKLVFRDLIIDNKPFPFQPRRRSRKGKKVNNFILIRISLTDIVWSEGVGASVGSSRSDCQPGGLAQGIAGFLAGFLPAPGTPPDDQKTPTSDEFTDPSDVSRSNSGLGRRDTNANEIFRLLKTKKRSGRTREGEDVLYEALIRKLEGGMDFRAVMGLLEGIISSMKDQ